MKKNIPLALAVVLGISFADSSFAKTIPTRNISRFLVTDQVEVLGKHALRFRGHLTESAFFCGKPEIELNKEQILVKIPYKVIGNGSHSFDFVVDVPKETKRALFGEDKIEVWPSNLLIGKRSKSESLALDAALKKFSKTVPNVTELDCWYSVTDISPSFYSVEIYHYGVDESEFATFDVNKFDFTIDAASEIHTTPKQ